MRTGPGDPAIGTSGLQHLATFCGQCNCGCPELYLDPHADDPRRVITTDDFGQRITMTLPQLADLEAGARNRVQPRRIALDEILVALLNRVAIQSRRRQPTDWTSRLSHSKSPNRTSKSPDMPGRFTMRCETPAVLIHPRPGQALDRAHF